MNRLRNLTVGAALLGLLAGGVVYAQGPAAGGPGRGPGRAGFGGPGFGRGAGLPLGELNLSDAQREQIRTARQQHQNETRAAAQKLRAAAEAQRKALETIPANESAIRAASEQLGEAQTEMAVLQARLRSEIYGLLTPEQQATVKKLQADRAARRQQRETRMRERMQRRQQQRPN